MLAVLIIGVLMNLVVMPLAARRVLFLYRTISSGQPAPDRIEGVTSRVGAAIKRQVVEVFAQKKMLKWTVPGAAHFFVMWAFIILGSVYVEAYGSLIKLLIHGGKLPQGVHLSWAIPLIGHWAVLGFLQDFIAVMCLAGLATFVYIRVKNAPKELGRRSRFFGSHLGPAWFTLFMIFNVIWTLFLFRGAGAGLEPGAPATFPYTSGAWVSLGVGHLLSGITNGALEVIEGIGLLLHIGVALGFLIFVLNSKHLHIFLAPLNIMFGRTPVALGAAKPLMSDGKPVTLEDLDDLDEDSKLGVGATEEFSWKGILDFATCTECGRCQSQCPAWNTEKPLSPKLMIMALRDSQMAKAPYLIADESKREALLDGDTALKTEVERPLVGDTGDEWFYMPEDGSAVIDPDVLWSCVTCGACVQQCPVDIEHVDHIVDMRRYQVLVESNFPAELNGLFKGMENKGNPWNMSASARMDWAQGLDFDVKVVGDDVESLDEVDWLFWVGCAGAYEDRAKKTTRAVAELLDMAGVSFAVLGNGETCTGDSARRAGNEFVFQGLAEQNIETFKEYKVKKVVSTCAHCFNTLKNEYQQLGYELEVVHHTQLLNRLVREKKLTPVAAQGGSRSVTYHDPCYIGRHNQVYEPPRELLDVIPDADFVEMPRHGERSFCCGAGGARMWMEETIGTRINETRTAEAVATGADQIAVGCPFCRVMLSDGLTSAQSKGEAREEVEVLDVAQMLLASVKGEAPKKAAVSAGAVSSASAAGSSGGGTATIEKPAEEKSEPTPASSGGSLFDTDGPGDTDDADDAATTPAEKPASSGGSLFDMGDDSAEEPAKSEEPATADAPAAKASGGSLFDIEDESADEHEPSAKADEAATPADDSAPAAKADLGSGGSLFDIGDDADDGDAPGEAKAGEDAAGDSTTDGGTDRSDDAADASQDSAAAPKADLGSGGSLFDIEEDREPEPAAKADAPAEDQAEDQAEDAVEDPAGDSTTDGDTDRSDDAADTDVAPDAEEPEAEKPEAEKPAAASSSDDDTVGQKIPEGTSLFDIAAPEVQPEAPKESARSDHEAEPAKEADPEPVDESTGDTEAAPIRSLKDIKAGASAAVTDAEPESAAEESPEGQAAEERAEQESENESDDEPSTDDAAADEEGESKKDAPAKPPSSGEIHEPKTDVDIADGGSLFDL